MTIATLARRLNVSSDRIIAVLKKGDSDLIIGSGKKRNKILLNHKLSGDVVLKIEALLDHVSYHDVNEVAKKRSHKIEAKPKQRRRMIRKKKKSKKGPPLVLTPLGGQPGYKIGRRYK